MWVENVVELLAKDFSNLPWFKLIHPFILVVVVVVDVVVVIVLWEENRLNVAAVAEPESNGVPALQ